MFNAPYRLALRGGGYPMTFEDAACAVRFARQHAAQFGGDSDTVTVVGYSAGAHIGAVTALAGDSFEGDCSVDSGSALPDGFVGVAGPYDSDVFDPLLVIFFGTDRAEDPAPWEDGNPYTHVGANPDLVVRLIQGELDLLVPAGFAVDFNDALEDGRLRRRVDHRRRRRPWLGGRSRRAMDGLVRRPFSGDRRAGSPSGDRVSAGASQSTRPAPTPPPTRTPRTPPARQSR